MASLIKTHPKYSGFTLIELVITLILIGIIAVSVSPKFFRGGFTEQSLRSQLLSRLQLLQTQSMNHYANGYCLQIDASVFYSGIYSGGSCVQLSGSESVSIDASLSVSEGRLVFDNLGRVVSASSSLCSALPCTLSISGSEILQLQIESQGYIHAL